MPADPREHKCYQLGKASRHLVCLEQCSTEPEPKESRNDIFSEVEYVASVHCFIDFSKRSIELAEVASISMKIAQYPRSILHQIGY